MRQQSRRGREQPSADSLSRSFPCSFLVVVPDMSNLGPGLRGRIRRVTEPLCSMTYALIDGLAVHTALRPDLMKPEQIVAVVRLHLDALGNKTGLPQPEQSPFAQTGGPDRDRWRPMAFLPRGCSSAVDASGAGPGHRSN